MYSYNYTCHTHFPYKFAFYKNTNQNQPGFCYATLYCCPWLGRPPEHTSVVLGRLAPLTLCGACHGPTATTADGKWRFLACQSMVQAWGICRSDWEKQGPLSCGTVPSRWGLKEVALHWKVPGVHRSKCWKPVNHTALMTHQTNLWTLSSL